MTPQAFRAWRKDMEFTTQAAAADALQVSLPAVKKWESGASPIDHRTALACAALYHRIAPWTKE